MRRFVSLGALEREAADDMLSWRHSGFSLHGAGPVAVLRRAADEALGKVSASVRAWAKILSDWLPPDDVEATSGDWLGA